MIIKDTIALQSLRPNKQFVWRGSEYSGLEWLDSGTAPIERDKRLTACDWRASSDLTLADAWKTYRQALRDLPASSTPKVDTNGDLDLTSVTWPTEPS